MVSSRLLCVECGCEAEPFAEIEEEDEVDGRQALKEAIANVARMNQRPTAPLPMVDIRDAWHRVAFDGLVALSCNLPIIFIPAAWYMVKRYLLDRWELVFPQEHDCERRWRTWVSNEAITWFMLLDVGLRDIFTCEGDCTAQSDFASLPVHLLTNALSLSSLLLLRILEVQIVDVSAHVHVHKVKVRNKMAAAAEADPTGKHGKAMLFLNKLQKSFPEIFGRSRPPRTLIELYQTWDTTDTPVVLRRMCYMSTLFLFTFLLWMQLATAQNLQSMERPCLRMETSKDVWTLISSLVKSYGAAVSWFHFILSILCISKGMGQNAKQLLLFGTLTSYSNIESWSWKDRERLRELLDNALVSNNRSDAIITENQLHQAMDSILGTERLDLLDLDDIRAWWELRKYIQVDFLDESASMDYCGVLVLEMILCFLVTGSFDWLANADPFSPGIVLVMTLVACLGVIMFNVIQACIDINELLERDSQVLVDAAADAILSRQWNSGEVASLLQSIERRVAMLDDKQQILGVTMTATYRNGWVASLGLAGVTSGMQLLQNMRREVTEWMISTDEMMYNLTLEVYRKVLQNETAVFE